MDEILRVSNLGVVEITPDHRGALIGFLARCRLLLHALTKISMNRGSFPSWQLRVYQGPDPDTGRQRWLTRTVHGSRRLARRQLEDLVAEAGRARVRAGTLADLLDQWFQAASPGWAVSTVSHTRSVIDCYLSPHLGHLHLAKVTTADIDDFYGYLLRAGGRGDSPLAPGTVARVYGVLHRALAQAVR
jgi:hypothetical protein